MGLRVAILGAGRLGMVLARLAVAAGHEVRLAASGDPRYIRLAAEVYAPGALPTTAADALEGADLVVLAIPLHRITAVPADLLAGRIVVDAMNHWASVDGPLTELTDHPGGTSVAVASLLRGAKVVKALNHVKYDDLDGHARDGRRIAMGIATNHAAAAQTVTEFVTTLGFEAVPIGGLDRGASLQPGTLAFGAALDRERLLRAIDADDVDG